MPTQKYKRNTSPLPASRLIIGRKPVTEALMAATAIEKIFVLKTAGGAEIADIKRAAKAQNIPLSLVPPARLNRFTRASHQGVVAIAALIPYMPLQAIISTIVEDGKTPLILILDGVTDTRNLGAIARSAYCYGAHALVIPAAHNASITEESIKASAGALEHLPVCRTATAQEAVRTVRLNGLQVVATALHATKNISAVDFTVPAAVVLGAEDTGVSDAVLKIADHLAGIPMSSNFDSLNVSVAAGIILYEAFKQNMH